MKPGRNDELTPRENVVAKLMAEGLSVAQIAEKLGAKESSVRTYIRNVREKERARAPLRPQ